MRPPGGMDTTDSETETESLKGAGSTQLSTVPGGTRKVPPVLRKRESTPAALNQSAVQSIPQGELETLRQRHATHDSSGDVSTDSEWEKVGEGQ